MLFDACVDRCLALLTLRALKTREIHDGVTSVSRRITGHAGWVTLPDNIMTAIKLPQCTPLLHLPTSISEVLVRFCIGLDNNSMQISCLSLSPCLSPCRLHNVVMPDSGSCTKRRATLKV